MWPWITEGLVPLGDGVFATVIWDSLNLQSVCNVRRNHWTNSSRIQPTIRSKCSPTFSSHCKWKNLESNTKLLFLLFVVALFTDKLDSAGELSSALRLTSSISFFVEICSSKWWLWESTVFLSKPSPFWAVPLRMSVKQTSVAKNLANRYR